MKKIIVFFFLPFSIFAQQDSTIYKFWISFTDKNNSPYSVSNPEEFLSLRAIERRNRQNIEVSKQDFPVNTQYVDSIKNLGFQILNRSRWFNGIMVATNDSSLANKIDFPFVKELLYFGSWQNAKSSFSTNTKWNMDFKEADYGQAYRQIEMLGGDFLHQKNKRGEGMQIAVLDAGFSKADEMLVFNRLFAEGRVLGTHDFVLKNNNVFAENSHGMMVLSTMGAENNGQMIGTAPDASFWLLRSEDVFSENLIEEYNWLCAAEFADSTGSDIINSSLGYTTFDDAAQNHSYADMYGKMAPASIAATMAASKGMIVVNSAGNSGSSSWHYIGAPADADSILSVGAVDENAEFAWFSSYGPSADGRVKPTVVAQGRNTIVATTDNGTLAGNGTSFSSPVLAGLTACLWQAHPNRSNMEIINAIIKSADLYANPNDSLGYGLPNFALADLLLSEPIDVQRAEVFSIFPNPVNQNTQLLVYAAQWDKMQMEVISANGQLIQQLTFPLFPLVNNQISLDFLSHNAAGVYWLKIQIGHQELVQPVLVANN